MRFASWLAVLGAAAVVVGCGAVQVCQRAAPVPAAADEVGGVEVPGDGQDLGGQRAGDGQGGGDGCGHREVAGGAAVRELSGATGASSFT